MLKLLKECKNYSVSTYAYVEISLNTCRNTLDFMCGMIWNCFAKSGHILLLVTCINNYDIYTAGVHVIHKFGCGKFKVTIKLIVTLTTV